MASNSATPTFAVNAIVDRLLGYLPFQAAAGSLYEEHVPPDHRLEYPTKALGYLERLLTDPRLQLIILTGNAGHGKTHLCRRLLVRGGMGPQEAMNALKSDLTGKETYGAPTGCVKRLRIIKDLSEVPSAHDAPSLLRDLFEDPTSIGIVCANEGRLRDVASRDPSLQHLLEVLELGLRTGRTTKDGRVHVLNLNHQSVAPRDGGFLEQALVHFTDGRRWTTCQTCKAVDRCPIYETRSRLVAGRQGDVEAQRTRAALIQLIRIAEQAGQLVAFREALILIAFLLTGGRRCSDVHEKYQRGEEAAEGIEWLLFACELTAEQREQLGVLERIRRLDPGRASIRSVDERLHRELEDGARLGDEVMVSAGPPARTRRELSEERETHQELIRKARRRDFFAWAPTGPAGDEARALRLGFQHYRQFELLFDKNPDQTHMINVLETLIAGLHAVQGVRSAIRQSLCIVDPAFAREGNRSAVLARTIPQKRLELLSESRYWAEMGDQSDAPDIPESCDWIDRRVVLALRERKEVSALLSLDLFQFEFVLRAGKGVVLTSFHAADRRRILARLAIQTEGRTSETDEIRIADGKTTKTISVERDGRIEVVEGQ